MHGINLMPKEHMRVASTFEDQNEGLGAFHYYSLLFVTIVIIDLLLFSGN